MQLRGRHLIRGGDELRKNQLEKMQANKQLWLLRRNVAQTVAINSLATGLCYRSVHVHTAYRLLQCVAEQFRANI